MGGDAKASDVCLTTRDCRSHFARFYGNLAKVQELAARDKVTLEERRREERRRMGIGEKKTTKVARVLS
eukprot:764579-Hanusia_phi.AAC.2